MTNSQELYNQFAPYYRAYSEKKEKYIEAVNKIIINNSPGNISNVLDIGAGDGIRGTKLFKILKAKNLVQIDNSRCMLQLMKKGKRVGSIMLDISTDKLPKKIGKYDIIFCLWNVLGHIETPEARLRALKNIRSLLRPGGRFFIDISNRYNAKYYGWKNAFRNLCKDIISPNTYNGDFKYKINVSKNLKVQAESHFFSPKEITILFKKSGFKLLKKYYIDYESGKICKFSFEGQLAYVLELSR